MRTSTVIINPTLLKRDSDSGNGLQTLPNETAFAVSETDEGSVKLSGCFTHPAFIAGLSAVRRQGGFLLKH